MKYIVNSFIFLTNFNFSSIILDLLIILLINKYEVIVCELKNVAYVCPVEQKLHQMNIQLFLRDQLIVSHPINTNYMSYPNYLSGVKSQLQEKYKNVIEISRTSPTFYIQANSSTHNRKRFANNNRPLL